MTITILVTGSTDILGSEELVLRQILEKKDINFLKLGAFSKVTLIFQKVTRSKPIMLRKFEEDYTEKEIR
jgi:hypothetical protein